MILRRQNPPQRNRFPLAALLGEVATVVVAPAAAGAAATAIAPTVVHGAITVTPATAGSAAGAVSPTVVLGAPVTVTPASATSTATAIAPTVVLGAIAIAPGAASSATSARFVLLAGATTAGVLVQSSANGRYFENDSGPVVLSGFHTWYEFQDGGLSYPPTAFDYADWLDYLDARGVNLHKMWVLETARYWSDADAYFDPLPFARTGPGNAADGRPKFDLTQFNQSYFDRLRERVILAGNRGHYVAVQLFQGWNVTDKGLGNNPFIYHPFNGPNNVNSIDGDIDNDNNGEETRNLANTAIIALQEAYVAKVVDTLNDLDNVLWEISNEEDNSAQTVAWQNHWVDFLHTYEAGKAKQHPVGFTVMWPSGSDSDLTASNADWISPNNGNSLAPGTAGGSQVILFDTDHIVGLTTEHEWIWQSFTRGYNPVYMDVYDGALYGADMRADASHERIRRNLGWVLAYAAQLDLANTTPQSSLASTGYCLARTTGAVKLVAYQHTSGAFTVNLTGLAGTFAIEWLRTAATTPTTADGGTVAGGATRTLTPPWAGEDALAFLELISLEIAPAFAAAALAAIAPTVVLGTLVLAPAAAGVAASAVAPIVVLGAVAVAPTAAGSATVAIAPAIVLGAVSVTPAVAVGAATAIAPAVLLGGLTLAPSLASAAVAAVDPAVVHGALVLAPTFAVSATIAIAPTVIEGEAVTVAPAAAEATAAAVAPTAVHGAVTIIPDAAAAGAAAINPIVTTGGVTVAPEAASAAGSAIAPTVVLGAITIAPAEASAVAAAIAPTVIQGNPVVVTPDFAEAVAGAIDPAVVLGAITIAPDVALALAVAGEPAVVLGAITLAPDAAGAQATAVNPTVQEGAAVTLAPAAAAAAAAAQVGSVVLGPVSISPTAAGAAAGAVNPAVVIGLIVAVVTLSARRDLVLHSTRTIVLTFRR